MRNLLFTAFAILILTGCSITGNYNKLRYVKSDQQKTEKQLKPNTNTEYALRTESSFTNEAQATDTLTNTNETTQIIAPVKQKNQDSETSKTTHQSAHQEKKIIVKKVNDIDPDDEDPDDEDHVEEALETERNARIAVILYAISVFTAFTIVFGVIFFFVARMYYRRANDSKYNTEQGARLLNAANILRIIALVFLILDLIYFLFILGALIYLIFFGWW